MEEQKSISFPEDRSVGKLYNLGNWATLSRESLETPAEALDARGALPVGKGDLLKLQVSPEASEDLSFLRELRANDLNLIDLGDTPVRDEQLKHLENFKSLTHP